MTNEIWHECGGISVCEIKDEPDCIEDYLDYLKSTNQNEKLRIELDLLADTDYLRFLKYQYGYDINQDPDIERYENEENDEF